MVPCEQYFIAVEKKLVAAGMSGRGDELEIIIDLQESHTCDNSLDAARCGAVSLVHDARAMEMRGEFGVVGDVIAMREKHEIDAAHLLDAFYAGIVEPRRIDQDVAALFLRANDQVGPCTEAGFRRETAKIDIVHNVGRKRFDAGAGASAGRGAA